MLPTVSQETVGEQLDLRMARGGMVTRSVLEKLAEGIATFSVIRRTLPILPF